MPALWPWSCSPASHNTPLRLATLVHSNEGRGKTAPLRPGVRWLVAAASTPARKALYAISTPHGDGGPTPTGPGRVPIWKVSQQIPSGLRPTCWKESIQKPKLFDVSEAFLTTADHSSGVITLNWRGSPEQTWTEPSSFARNSEAFLPGGSVLEFVSCH